MLRSLVALTLIAACGDPGATPSDASGDAHDGSIDASPRAVTAHVLVHPISNDASHVPVLGSDVLYRQSTVALRTADRMDVALTVGAAGDFGFSTSDDKYRVAISLDSSIPVEYQLRGSQLDPAGRYVGRYDRTAVPAATTLAVTVTSPPGGGVAAIASTGVYTQTTRPNTSANSTFTIDWTQVTSLFGPRGLLDATQNDRAYYVVFEDTGTVPQYTAISSSCTADITMNGGTSNAFACTAAALPQSTCMHAIMRFNAETTRVGVVSGALYPYYFANWIAEAVAMPESGISGGLSLASQFSNGSTQPADIDRNFAFGNPYPGTDMLLLMSTGKYRSFALPGGNPTSVGSAVTVYQRVGTDCSAPTETATGLVALASFPRIDGVHLDSDATSVGLADGLHTLAWDIASPGAVDYWVVRVYRASLNASNNTILVTARVYVTLDREVVLDAADFMPGKPYFVEVMAVAGVPNAAAGDFRTFTYPYATGSVFSSVFRITE